MNVNFYRLFPLLLLIFIDSFSHFIVIPVLLVLFYSNHYGLLSPATTEATRNLLTGCTVSLPMLAALIAAPFVGNASDKYGRKNTLLVCLGAIIMGFLLPIIGILQQNIYLILIGRCLGGIGSVSQPVAQAAVTDLCQGKEKSYYLSLIAFAMTLALVIAPLAGGYLSDSNVVSWFNVTTPFLFALSLSIISLFLLIFFFKETVPSRMRTEMFSFMEVITSLNTAIKRYHVGRLFFLFLCLELGWSQYYQSIFLYLSQTFHYSPEQVSLFNTYMGILMAAALLGFYPLLIRYVSVLNTMRGSITCVLLGLVGCALFPTPMMQWVFTPLITIFTGCAYVSLVTLISNHMPANQQGRVMGYASTLLFFAWTLTGVSSGWLISLYNKLPLYTATGMLLIAGLALIPLPVNYLLTGLTKSIIKPE